MKYIKKILVLLLILALMTALTVTAFAADPDVDPDDDPSDDPTPAETFTITIKQNADENEGVAGAETYALYKIFDVTKISTVQDPVTTDDTIAAQSGTGYTAPTGFAYTISKTSPWFAVLGSVNAAGAWTAASGQSWVTLIPIVGDSTKYNVSWTGTKSEAAAKAFAEWLLLHKGTTIAADETMTSAKNADGEMVATANVASGYYLITSSLGTNLVLATTDIDITTKNEYITDEKVAETASVTIGERETYYIKVYLPASIDPTKLVTVHDILDPELKFNDDTKVYVGTSDPGSTAAAYKELTYSALDGHYLVKQDELTDDCSFHIEITVARASSGDDDPGLSSLAGKYLVFRYSAELTSEADPDEDGYVNEEFTTYSEYETVPSNPVFVTYDFDLNKVDEDGDELEGAEFEMYDVDPATITTVYYTNGTYEEESDVETEFSKPSAEPFKFLEVQGGYRKADKDDTGTVTTLEAGSINIAGFGAGTYWLLETKAPNGFNKLAYPLVITFTDAEGTEPAGMTVTLNNVEIELADVYSLDVENQSGTVLPSTGGIGTTIFYVAGGLIIVSAALVLILKKRSGKDA